MNATGQVPSRWKWTHWLLLASLVLNGLLGGYLIGRLAGPPHWRMPHPPMAGEPSSPFTLGALPTPLRDAMRAKLRENRGEARKMFEGLRTARGELREAIGAEPFDPARLAAAFAGLRAAQGALQQDLHAIAVEVVTQMTPEERKRIADWRPDIRPREEREPRGR